MLKHCLLDELTRASARCKGDCDRCGWNREEAKLRENLIAEKKFTTRWDGVKMLTITRKENEE